MQDEDLAVSKCRWFHKRYPFSTDASQFPLVVSRVLRGKSEAFNAGPEQKFYLRMIKVMDFSLLDDASRAKLKHQGALKHVSMASEAATMKQHDPSLLALYGHFMFMGGGISTALGYYFRAYVLVPNDPIINLCLGLTYIGLAMKRQALNRQFHIQQGISFINAYHRIRMESAGAALERQEAEFNVAVTWHTLGLTHLAMRAYQRCIELAEFVELEEAKKVDDDDEKDDVSRDKENFAVEAAYALRNIMVANGNTEEALRLTRRFLVL